MQKERFEVIKMNTTRTIEPYSPVQYSHLECRLFNLVSSRRIVFNMGVGKEQVSVRLTFDSTPLPYQGMSEATRADLAFEAADELWQISFEQTRCLYELMEQADGGGFFADTPPESLPEDVRWAVVEAFLSESLSRMETLLGSPIKIAAPVNPVPFDCFSLRFEISFGQSDTDKRVHGLFQIPFKASSVGVLEGLLSGFPPRRWQPAALSRLEKTLSFEAGSLVLTAGDVCAMEVGDVLIPDRWYPKENRMALGIGPRLFVCEYDEKTLAVTVNTQNGSARGETTGNQPLVGQIDTLGKEGMTEQNATLENAHTDELTDTGSLDLTLVFEVARTTMTIEQIGQLTRGQVIRMPHKLDAGVPVDIKVNEQLIARGKIVGIGDDMAVQITHQALNKA